MREYNKLEEKKIELISKTEYEKIEIWSTVDSCRRYLWFRC